MEAPLLSFWYKKERQLLEVLLSLSRRNPSTTLPWPDLPKLFKTIQFYNGIKNQKHNSQIEWLLYSQLYAIGSVFRAKDACLWLHGNKLFFQQANHQHEPETCPGHRHGLGLMFLN
jgi:hypothetical protein